MLGVPFLPSPPDANNCRNSDVWLETRSQKEFGRHTPKFTEFDLREKVCIFCDQRKPASLEELAFSVLVTDIPEFIKMADSAFRHLPHRICWLIGRLINANLIATAWQLVPLVAEYGENRPSWFEVEIGNIKWLSRFRYSCEVHQVLRPYMSLQSAAIPEFLQYHNSYHNTYDDFWSWMQNVYIELQAETTTDESMGILKSVKPSGRGNVVLVSPELSEHITMSTNEYLSMKALHKLNQTLAIPIVFKPTSIALRTLDGLDIMKLLEDLDPEVIYSVDVKQRTWSVWELDQLALVLSSCRNLTKIYLRQVTTDDGEIEDVAPAISRVLRYHGNLQKIGLQGFQLAGTLASFPLPPVENLRLRLCTFTEEDWNFMANRSDLALKKLFVSSYFYDIHFPSFSVFILNQAPTLESLGLEYPTLTVDEICNILRIMAKFNRLLVFSMKCMEQLDFASIERISIDVASIHCARKCFIDIPSVAGERDRDAELNETVSRFCKFTRRPPILVMLDTY